MNEPLILIVEDDPAALMDYIGRALGYVLVAFLVAYVNAALVAAFTAFTAFATFTTKCSVVTRASSRARAVEDLVIVVVVVRD